MDLPVFKAVKPKSGSRVKGSTTEMDLPVIKAVPAQNKVCDKGEEPPAQVKPVFRAVKKVLSPEMDSQAGKQQLPHYQDGLASIQSSSVSHQPIPR